MYLLLDSYYINKVVVFFSSLPGIHAQHNAPSHSSIYYSFVLINRRIIIITARGLKKLEVFYEVEHVYAEIVGARGVF